jgi:large subunit ribosomal protein L33
MPKKKKVTRKDKRPIIKLMCTHCNEYVVTTRKNPINTPDRVEIKKFCPNAKCKGRFVFKETK